MVSDRPAISSLCIRPSLTHLHEHLVCVPIIKQNNSHLSLDLDLPCSNCRGPTEAHKRNRTQSPIIKLLHLSLSLPNSNQREDPQQKSSAIFQSSAQTPCFCSQNHGKHETKRGREPWCLSLSLTEMQSNLLPVSHSMPTVAMAPVASLCKEEDRLVISHSRSSSIDDDVVGMPLLHPRSSTSSNNHQRRRRAASDTSLLTLSTRQRSFSRDVGHAASETYLLTRLSFRLLRYLGVGYRWIAKFLALGCYAMLLMPGFLQVGYYYFFSSQVRRSIIYGDQPRNRLDLYLPANIDEPKPVVAFVTGGAWIIGYKAWGALLGQQLAEKGIIVACIDYRNFPQGTISDMVKDVSLGISFVCNNISEYGGDPNRIYLIGQSAGAHIAACALLDQAIKECGEGEHTSWGVSQIKAYFGISGGYNILNLVDHFHRRGLYRSIFLSIMEGDHSLERFSPEVMVQDPRCRRAVSLLPPIILFHGTADYSIPSDASKTFADVLQGVGVQVELILYEGKTHTDLFLQDPLRGGKDELLEDILKYIHADDVDRNKDATPRRRLVPEFMLRLAHKVSPF